MSGAALTVVRPGLQTTIQAGHRRGRRHLGVPACGAADPVSSALANRLVGNAPDAPTVEVTLTGAAFRALRTLRLAVVGALCEVKSSGLAAARKITLHAAFDLHAGHVLDIGPATAGCRTYVAVRGRLVGEEAFGSVSTYLPAGFGGRGGRTLRAGDVLDVRSATPLAAPLDLIRTPPALCPPFGGAWTLRAVPGPEAHLLDADGLTILFGEGWRAGQAADRTGVRLDGPVLPASGDARMDSVATLPGTVQLPPVGTPIILGVDGGTTGGYPRVAQVIRADRHLIGQLRPGDPVRLLRWEARDASKVLTAKEAMVRAWVGEAFRL